MPRRPRPQPPLPPRDGLGAARVTMPRERTWSSVAAFLAERTGDEPGVGRRMAEGEVLLADGTQVRHDTPYLPGGTVYLYRDLPEEPVVPGDLPVLLHDEESGLLAVDKPAFLATMPRGGHVVQSAVVRLRRELDLPDLAPVHRLDRLTSGVLLLTTRREARSAYQRMVQAGGLAKTYEALAPLHPDLALPRAVENRIVKERGTLQARVEAGEPNARTLVELLGEARPSDGDPVLGHYRLTPTTGRTHQLRLHLAGLGIPIVGDPLYPVVREVSAGDFSKPLQLLASRIAFTDPVSGQERRISSTRTLPICPPPP